MVLSKILEVKNVSKSYGKIEALNSVSFVVPEGKVAGLVGPNGSGKTTLIKCLNGFLTYDGQVEIGTTSQMEMNRANIGYQAESEDYYSLYTAEEYLTFYAKMYSLQNVEKRVSNMLDLVGLSERGSDPINTFSKGMKKRLGMARTLIHDPDLIILDEPLSGLDPIIKQKLRKIIEDISSENKSFLISSHQLRDIEDVCDWTILIQEGNIVDFGLPKKISLKQGAVKELLLEIDKELIERAMEIEELDCVIKVKKKGEENLLIKGNDEEFDWKVMKWIIEHNIRFSLKRGSLDSMYRSVFE